MHYTSVYTDPPKTSGPLVPFLWLFCLRWIPLLIPDLPHCCPIKLLRLCINDSLLLCSDSSLAYWCSLVISITLSLSHLLIYYSACDSLPYQSILSCSLLIPLLSSLFMLPMLTHFCLCLAYWSLTKPLQSSYQSLTNPWQILLTPFSFCTLILCPPMYLNPWAQPSDHRAQ